MSNLKIHQTIDQSWPVNDLEFLGRCPLCGNDQSTTLYEGLRDYIFYTAPGSWTLHKCNGCCCAYLDPRPTPETMGKAYDQYYTHKSEINVAPEQLIKQLKRVAKNGYLNRKWKTSLSPASKLMGILLLPSMRSFIDEEFMRNLPNPSNGRSILDIGCGAGEFLALAKNAGWRAVGVDLDPKAVECARSKGLDVQLGDIDCFATKTDCFDSITLSHVIEHVYNPKELLESCYRLLKPAGYFWIETPNIESYGHSKYKENWRGVETPRHLQLISWEKLQKMLEDAGFKQVTKAHWRPEFQQIHCSSKAIIQKRNEPYKMKASFLDRLISQYVELINRYDPSKREFITYYATKYA